MSDINREELNEIAQNYNIPIHLPTQTQDFWKKWNDRVNLSANELSDEELLKIIGSIQITMRKKSNS